MKVRGRIFASGAFAGLAIAVAALIVLSPLIAARTDLRRIANNGVPVQAQLVELRTTVVEWQSFIERQLDGLTPGVAPDPIKVVEGGQLLSEETGQAVAMSRELRRIG